MGLVLLPTGDIEAAAFGGNKDPHAGWPQISRYVPVVLEEFVSYNDSVGYTYIVVYRRIGRLICK
jgi:hypothetical protein